MVASTAADYTVADVPGRQRFEIRAGERVAGFTEYRRHGGLIAFIHTEVDPEFEGQGVGGRLISAALDAVREEGLAVLPFCPFVRGYIAKHPEEYLDLVPEAQRAEFDLPADA
jgi:predicted GNAT family acetyltransferase